MKTEIIKKIAVTITNTIKQYQTKLSKGNRKTLSVYDSFGDRSIKREPVFVGEEIY